MTRRRPAAPMPVELRGLLRAKAHPSRSVECPHCGARVDKPCTTRSKRHPKAAVCWGRLWVWATTVACCPACQVEPTVPCHDGGRVLRGGAVHPQRQAEAEVTAA